MNKPGAKIIVPFVILISAGLIFSISLRAGIFPVAFVGATPIMSKALNEIYSAAMRYYGNLAQIYGEGEEELNAPEIKTEIRRATLNKLIDEIIVKSELEKRLGNDLKSVVQSKLGKVSKNNEELRNATRILYGLDFEEFEKFFLVPQSEYEILEGRLIMENVEIESWLTQARQTANVIILSPEFVWTGNSVELRD